ncbi:hypothetical protein BDV38DRAFT_255464 [Aspergillus pseudotamarii]|uniref:Transmembrane protein n=1 Tax=Aspergillus pseudotamarii TaxID=132259 RepID=A0A5N6SIC6_ASPPS|nr:uncharacterized protein BDV38DRAFT_255464 [Aspergillus pseudotamarii]KAE8134436.1 hypothetical protein BDV38DRAFT_255464 [Aspergillus pseudotamarii]
MCVASILDGRLGLTLLTLWSVGYGSFCILCIVWLCVICDGVSPLIVTLLMGSVVGVRVGKAEGRHIC